jgi:hypothetical protein
MEAFITEQTETSPKITLDPANHIFEISGISRPEDVRDFYYPVFDWFEKFKIEVIDSKIYIYDKDNPLNFKIKLSYFNSSSAIFLSNLLTEFNKFHEQGQYVKIYWFFEEDDDDMREAGEELSEMLELTFNYVAVRK